MNALVRRQKAVQATMERFRDRAFAWGSVDCAKMVAFHLKQMGHKVRLSKAGQYKTALGATAALKRLGYETLPDAMDGHGFTRIAPAFALIGDVVSFASDHPIGALGIVVGNGNMMAFHELHTLPVIMSMGRIDTGWQVL
ncbi:MAG: hypothetical protein QG584_1832 [Pseudomonadota bacterium]|nr:hypothetical protein [Pseudomonadota bacterium]